MTNPEFSDVRKSRGFSWKLKISHYLLLQLVLQRVQLLKLLLTTVITDVEKKRKFVCVDPHDIPVVAIVDPDMSASMPKVFVHQQVWMP